MSHRWDEEVHPRDARPQAEVAMVTVAAVAAGEDVEQRGHVLVQIVGLEQLREVNPWPQRSSVPIPACADSGETCTAQSHTRSPDPAGHGRQVWESGEQAEGHR